MPLKFVFAYCELTFIRKQSHISIEMLSPAIGQGKEMRDVYERRLLT